MYNVIYDIEEDTGKETLSLDANTPWTHLGPKRIEDTVRRYIAAPRLEVGV